MHEYPTLLPGHLAESVMAALTVGCWASYAWEHVGNLKYDTFVAFRDLYSEYDFVFFGDNGQGDLLCAQRMCTEAKVELEDFTQPRTLGAFIQVVQPEENALAPLRNSADLRDSLRMLQVAAREASQDEPSSDFALREEISAAIGKNAALNRAENLRKGIYTPPLRMFKTYVGAALALHEVHPEVLPVKSVISLVSLTVDDMHKEQAMHMDFNHDRLKAYFNALFMLF